MLDVYAGETARKMIQQDGLHSELFTTFLGASGGPKWFSLFGLDKYLFGEFFKSRQTPLNLVGSSAGAFRAACFAQQDAVAAISRLAEYYSETTYSDDPTPIEITAKARVLLDLVFGENGVEQIINNPTFIAHFVVAKSNGLVSFENKALQMTGLLKSFAFNAVNRKWLRGQYERFIFYAANSNLKFNDAYAFATHYQALTKENTREALLASGSIPLVMKGIKDIPGAPKGMYRDGGIIDYHFDINFQNSDGLTLYPHFNANPKAGWFDKSLKRRVNPANYDKVVMLVPSDEFVSALPYSKIPDREDFTKLDASTRIQYWKNVLAETERLAEYFQLYLTQPELMDIKPIS